MLAAAAAAAAPIPMVSMSNEFNQSKTGAWCMERKFFPKVPGCSKLRKGKVYFSWRNNECHNKYSRNSGCNNEFPQFIMDVPANY